MLNKNDPKLTAYQLMLAQAFGLKHSHFEGSILQAEPFPENVREIFLAVVDQGRSITELERDRFSSLDELALAQQSRMSGKGRPHYRSFVSGMKSLLAHKDYHHKALDYIFSNHAKYKEMSDGLFDFKYSMFDDLIPVTSLRHLPNYCRQADGSLRDDQAITNMIMTVSDTKVLLWSAMANMDAEALSLLTQNKRFSSANTETWLYSHIREQIQVCQNIDLKCAFSHLFKKRTHTIFLAEMKQLMSSPASTYSDFSTAFWPEASRTVIDNLVAEAVKSDTKEKPQMALMLHAFLDYGKVNLYPGLVKSRQGDGPYFDIVDALPDLATQQAYLMDAVVEQSKSQKIVYKTDLSPLLCNIPLETLAAHKHSDALLKHLYQGTRDRRVLKLINDNQFRGQALEDQLGM